MLVWLRAALTALVVLVGCGDASGDRTAAARVERGSAEAIRIVPLADGSCARGRRLDAEGRERGPAMPAGAPDRYQHPLWVTEERVRVRANAAWPEGDQRNVIGTIAGHRLILGQGPLRDAEVRAGVGYAIVVQDARGRRCRGYLSLTVLRHDPP